MKLRTGDAGQAEGGAGDEPDGPLHDVRVRREGARARVGDGGAASQETGGLFGRCQLL